MQTAAGSPAAVSLKNRDFYMCIYESAQKSFICEICQKPAVNPLTMGVESEIQFNSVIQLCRACGPVNLDLMQICRESTVGCMVN